MPGNPSSHVFYATRAAEAAYAAELAAQEAEEVAASAAFAADHAARAAERAFMPVGQVEMELLERLLQIVEELPSYEESAAAAGKPAMQMVSTLLQSAALAARAAVMAATTQGAAELLAQSPARPLAAPAPAPVAVEGPAAAGVSGASGGSGPSTTVDADPDAPAVMTQPISRSAPDDGTADQAVLSLGQLEAEAAMRQSKCNAATDEEAAALEQAAAAVPTGGKFVTSGGWGITGTPGAIGVEYIEKAAAEERVKASTQTMFGFLTIDANPEGYPKILCHNGFPLLHSPQSAQVCTAHLYRPEGCLPTAAESTLFVDGLQIHRPGALEPRRPGRAEGLADEYTRSLCLYGDTISPNDLRQGGLGNCWLISAFSAVAEFPSRIRHLIEQTELSKSGRYVVKLFHPIEEVWKTYAIDDRLPVNQYGHLRNVRLSASGELWPALLEKAMAALYGGYACLDGGNPYTALKCLTGTSGERLVCLSYGSKGWQCWTPIFKLEGSPVAYPTARQLTETRWPDDGSRGSEPRVSDKVLDMLRWLDGGKSIMCCGSQGYDDSASSESGIVQGHAYALLTIETNLGEKKFDLLKLRNPHGQGGKEWSGAWSDGDRMWKRYPDIAEKLQPAGKDDGTFWMAKEDFVKEFRSISICISDQNAAERYQKTDHFTS